MDYLEKNIDWLQSKLEPLLEGQFFFFLQLGLLILCSRLSLKFVAWICAQNALMPLYFGNIVFTFHRNYSIVYILKSIMTWMMTQAQCCISLGVVKFKGYIHYLWRMMMKWQLETIQHVTHQSIFFGEWFIKVLSLANFFDTFDCSIFFCGWWFTCLCLMPLHGV